MQKKPKSKAEAVPVMDAPEAAEQEVARAVAADLGVPESDVRVEEDVIVLTGEAAEAAVEEGWVDADEEEVDETDGGLAPPAPDLTLEQYARLKNLNAFRQGRITGLVGKAPRPESAWTRDITAVGG